jgi:RND family efflux transporter MFP subunit
MTITRALAFVAIALLSGCSRTSDVTRDVRPVRVREPQATACAGTLRFSGNVQPLARVDLAFKRGGYVREIFRVAARPGGLADEGDHVKRGTVLARLRDADYRVKLQQARAQLVQAKAAETQATQDLERVKKMFDGKAVPQSTLDGAENKASAATAQTHTAELSVEESELALADCALVAPLDAVIMKRMVEPGALVGPGSPGFILADTSSMKVTFGAPDVTLAQMKVGTKLQVLVEGRGQSLITGEVSRVAPMADPKSRLFEVEIILPNADGSLLAGMIASIRVDETAAGVPLAVPLTAVVRPPGEPNGFAVFVLEESGLKIRAISPGELCAGNVEVRSGLKPDERVVVEGAAQSFDGEHVRVVP